MEQPNSSSHVFVCYSHKDAVAVVEEIDRLERAGCRVWYDRGIASGVRWSDELAQHILEARLVLYFASPQSAASENCLDEINFALDNSIPVLAVHLEKTELPAGAALRLSHRQAIHRYELDEADYRNRLNAAVGVAPVGDVVASPTKRRSIAPFMVVGGLLVGLIGYWLWSSGLVGDAEPKVQGSPSVAVLPFENMSSDADQEYFADGMAEEILNQLAKIPELRVISRTSAFSFKGRSPNIKTVAETLDVAHVLEGSVRKAGNQVRVTAQLIEAATDSRLWSESYNRDLDDIFAIQDEIARQVATRLRVSLLGERSTPTTSTLAYTNYLQARSLLNQFDENNHGVVQRLLREALEEDPQFALAWLELARLSLHQSQVGARTASEYELESRSAVRNAAAVDPASPNVLAWQAEQILSFDGDRKGAAQHYLEALRVAPTNIELLKYGVLLSLNLGRVEQAIEIGKRVITDDPLCTVCRNNLSQAYLYAGRLDLALEHTRLYSSLTPNARGAWSIETAILIYQGDPGAALDKLHAIQDPAIRMLFSFMALHDLGRDEEAQEQLQKLLQEPADNTQASLIARAYAWIGDNDEAFKWLDQSGVADQMLFDYQRYLDPVLLKLSDDPRWEEYLVRTNSTPESLSAIDFDIELQ